MIAPRCQKKLKNGRQCSGEADWGKITCKMHEADEIELRRAEGKQLEILARADLDRRR